MDLNKFTQKSQQALSEAQAVAVRMGQQPAGARTIPGAGGDDHMGLRRHADGHGLGFA